MWTWLKADYWRTAFFVLALALLGYGGWTKYWYDRWAAAELYRHGQAIQQITNYLNAQIAQARAAQGK